MEMEKLTDEQLMLLEQLTYLSPSVYGASGLKKNNADSVEELLSVFTEDRLKELEKSGAIGYTDGSEWAAIIRAIQSDKDLMRMEIVAHDESQGIYCFTDPKRSGEAFVAFQGTKDGNEWIDNVEGLTETDTDCQKAALDFIENLPYDDITVVGHSKGGNKAQYVTLLSDKINRCIAMDGQGFSQEFLDKYWAEIEANAGKIKNYSLSNDYVNILMFYVPGAQQIFCKGENEIGLKNHSPSSYYDYYQDENGDWYIVKNDNGDTSLSLTTQDEIMIYLHEFTCFVLNEMPDADKRDVIEYLGVLLAVAMDEHFRYEINGTIYTQNPGDGEKGITNLIALDLDTASVVVAYLVKYVEVYDLTEQQVRDLCEAFGMGEMLDKLLVTVDEFVKKYHLDGMVQDSGGLLMFLFKLLIGQVQDGEEDPLLEWILSFANEWLTDFFGEDVDASEFWGNIGKEYAKIGDVDVGTAKQDGKIKTGVVLDFSQNAYDALMNTIASIEGMTFDSVSEWSNYANEEWYGPLSVGIAVNGITKYFSHLSEINAECKAQIDRIFTNVKDVDTRYSEKVFELSNAIVNTQNSIMQYANNIIVT